MAYTQPPVKSNGSGTISKADLNTYLRDNNAFFRVRPTVKVKAAEQTTSDAVDTGLGLATGTEEWDNSSVHGSDNWLECYDAEPGVWYVGATGIWDADTTGDRRLRFYESSGGVVGSIISDYRTDSPNRPCRLTNFTSFNFSSGNSEFAPRTLQSSGGSLDTNGDAWGLFIADATSTTAVFADPGLTDAQGTTAWWQQLRVNMTRMYSRPAFRVYRSAALSIPNNTWTDMSFDTEAHDNCTGIGVDESVFVVPTGQAGLYFLHGCVRYNNMNAAGTFPAVRLLVNGSQLTHGVASNAEVGSADCSIPVCAVANLAVGDEVTMETIQNTGSSHALDVGVTNHMGGFMLSGRSATFTDRQYFTGEDGLPAQFSYDGIDSGFLPRGVVNVMARDYLSHLWNPPVIGVQAGDTSIAAGGFVDVDCGDLLYNAWGEDLMPASSWQTGGGIRVPQPGLWLAVASVRIGHEGAGATGSRGMKILHRSFSEGQVRVDGPTITNGDWIQTTSCLLDAAAGDEVKLQAAQHSGDETQIVAGSLTLAWMGDRP